MIKLIINGKEIYKDEAVRLEDLAKELGINAYCAKVNNRIRELVYVVKKDSTIEFLDLTSVDSMNVYTASLRYLITMAIKNIYPTAKVVFNYSISRSFLCEIMNIGPINNNVLTAIKTEMERIIEADYPITRVTKPKAEALKIYEELGYEDKAAILAYRPEDTVHFYECNGYLNYMFGYMVPKNFIYKRL